MLYPEPAAMVNMMETGLADTMVSSRQGLYPQLVSLTGYTGHWTMYFFNRMLHYWNYKCYILYCTL